MFLYHLQRSSATENEPTRVCFNSVLVQAGFTLCSLQARLTIVGFSLHQTKVGSTTTTFWGFGAGWALVYCSQWKGSGSLKQVLQFAPWGVKQNPDSGSNKLQRALALPPALSALLRVIAFGSDTDERLSTRSQWQMIGCENVQGVFSGLNQSCTSYFFLFFCVVLIYCYGKHVFF